MFLYMLLLSLVAFVLGQSNPLNVVIHTARTSRFGAGVAVGKKR